MRRLLFTLSFALTICTIPFLLAAQDIPTPAEAQKFLEFYYNGKGNGAVLVESKLCKDVHKEGNLKYECKNEIIEFGPLTDDGTPPEVFHKINKGDSIYVWMAFLVPVGAEEKIFIQYSKDGSAKRKSRMMKVQGSVRYRTWSKFTPSSAGDWNIDIFLNDEIEPVQLSSFVLTVN